MSLNRHLALIPNKHVRIDQSILALAGHCLTMLDTPKTADELYAALNSNGSKWRFKPSMDYIILALDTLYAIKKIEFTSDDRVRVKQHEAVKAVL